MRKVHDIHTVIELFVLQSIEEAMTPLCEIRGIGKGRRFYFKGDTAYSYGKHFPVARMVGDTMLLRGTYDTKTTRKHIRLLADCGRLLRKEVVYSDDLQSPKSLDTLIQTNLYRFLNSRTIASFYASHLLKTIVSTKYPITKSKFPLLFDEKHEKLRTMMLSKDKEIVDLVKKIIRKEKLI